MSKMFEYITGQATGPLAEKEAALEHALGHLGAEIEENARLRALNAEMLAALQAAQAWLETLPNASAIEGFPKDDIDAAVLKATQE